MATPHARQSGIAEIIVWVVQTGILVNFFQLFDPIVNLPVHYKVTLLRYKDQWTDEQLKTLVDWAQTRNNYGFALSNPKFEYWLLLHFEDGNGVITSADCDNRLKRNIPNYDKNIYSGAFTRERIDAAIDRAKRVATTRVARIGRAIRAAPPFISWSRGSLRGERYNKVGSYQASKVALGVFFKLFGRSFHPKSGFLTFFTLLLTFSAPCTILMRINDNRTAPRLCRRCLLRRPRKHTFKGRPDYGADSFGFICNDTAAADNDFVCDGYTPLRSGRRRSAYLIRRPAA